METADQGTLCRQLKVINGSLVFLILAIVSILLSFWSTLIQRRQLICTIEEESCSLPAVYPIKLFASALMAGSVGYFLSLAMGQVISACSGNDPVAKRSSSVNLWASLLVTAAVLLRLDDLNFVERCQSSLLNTETLPE